MWDLHDSPKLVISFPGSRLGTHYPEASCLDNSTQNFTTPRNKDTEQLFKMRRGLHAALPSQITAFTGHISPRSLHRLENY